MEQWVAATMKTMVEKRRELLQTAWNHISDLAYYMAHWIGENPKFTATIIMTLVPAEYGKVGEGIFMALDNFGVLQ